MRPSVDASILVVCNLQGMARKLGTSCLSDEKTYVNLVYLMRSLDQFIVLA